MEEERKKGKEEEEGFLACIKDKLSAALLLIREFLLLLFSAPRESYAEGGRRNMGLAGSISFLPPLELFSPHLDFLASLFTRNKDFLETVAPPPQSTLLPSFSSINCPEALKRLGAEKIRVGREEESL